MTRLSFGEEKRTARAAATAEVVLGGRVAVRCWAEGVGEDKVFGGFEEGVREGH